MFDNVLFTSLEKSRTLLALKLNPEVAGLTKIILILRSLILKILFHIFLSGYYRSNLDYLEVIIPF